jgi:hypothetical protein
MASLGAIRSRKEAGTKQVGFLTRSWPLLLFGGWILQVGIRLALSVHRTFPILIPDESGYLLAARMFAGGAVGDMSSRALYQAGYPLIISPAFWFSDDPTTVYRLIMMINSLVGASLFPLAYVTLRGLSLPRTQSYLVATVTSLLPAGIYYGQFAMSDAALPVMVLGWLLLVHSWIAGARWAYGAAASVVAAYTYCSHSRGAVIVAVHACLLVIAWWRCWTSRRNVALAGGALVAASAVAWALNAWLRERLYPGGTMPLGGWLVDRLTSADGLGWTLGLAAGKLWYLIVSTLGVAGVGLVAAGGCVLRRGAPRAVRAAAGLTLAAVAGIALASSAAVPDERTVGNFVYGRYLTCLSPVLFIAGAVFAVRATRRTAVRGVSAVASLALATGGIVWLHAGDRLTRYFFASFDFPESSFITWNWSTLRLWSTTWTALVVLTLSALVIANGRRDGVLICGMAFIAFGLAVVSVMTDRVTQYWARRLESVTSLAPAGLRPNDHVAMDYQGMQWRIWVCQAFEVRTGLKPLDRHRPATLPPDTTLVVVPWDVGIAAEKSWPAAPANWHPVAARQTYAGDWVAWRRAAAD